jgi:16S rRNA (adenine1518-N6/adenine1519-N6)-dimethyltransferase
MNVLPQADEPSGVRALLNKYDLRPRKRLGQHFLADPNILRKIVDAAQLSPQDVVLEIGPGLGMLTRRLAQAAGRVIAVELDEGMIGVLRGEMAHLTNLELVQGDILQLDPMALIQGPKSSELKPPLPYTVVANLPYYITSAAIRHLLEADPPPRRLVLTVQQEVAKRIVAKPGAMSLLAVSVQFYGQPRIVTRIPAGAFVPPPSVDSAVVCIDTFAPGGYDAVNGEGNTAAGQDGPTAVPVPDPKTFFRVARAGFGQKRKQLKNALAAGLGLSSADVITVMVRAGVEPHRRAQTLTLAEWANLACELDSFSSHMDS